MATKKTRPKKSLKKPSMAGPPPKPYSCKTPPIKPMGLEETANLLNTDPDFAGFFSNLLCLSNNGDPNAVECIEKFYQPTDGELAALCIPPAEFPQLQKCTEQNLLLSPIAYGITGKRGFSRRKR
jgi:hypothetical protein